jgi:hypothetical protein
MRLARRTSDITRLQSDLQRSMQDYQASVGQKEAVFNTQMTDYNRLYEGYKGRLDAYNTRLSDYQKRLKTYQDAPWESYNDFQVVSRLGPNVYASTQTRNYGNNVYGPIVPSGPFIGSMVRDPNAERGGIPTYAFTLKEGYSFSGPSSRGVIGGKSVLSPGEFTEKFEEQAPTAPTLDIAAEKAKLEADRAYTEREVDERTKSRLRAVQRASARPMLSRGTNING